MFSSRPRAATSALFAFSILLALLATGCTDKPLAVRSAQHVQAKLDLQWHHHFQPGMRPLIGPMTLQLAGMAEYENLLYVSTLQDELVAFFTSDGTQLWQQNVGSPVTAGPIATQRRLYIGLGNGEILAINRDTGKTIWRIKTGSLIQNSLTLAGNYLLALNANNRFYAINAENGTVAWKHKRPRNKELAIFGTASAVVDQNRVYIGYRDGFFAVYQLENGTMLWGRGLANDDRFSGINTTAIVTGNRIYVPTIASGLYCLNREDGKTIWHKDTPRTITDLVAFQGNLFTSDDEGVSRINAENGEIYWRHRFFDRAYVSPIALGKTAIYAAVSDFGVVILDKKTGRLRNVIDNGSAYRTPPLLTNGHLTLMSNRSVLYRYALNDTPVIAN